jgi:hypothetical protein
MTNWNRSPKGINAGRFIFDGQRRLVADMTSVSDSLVLLKKQNLVETPLGSTSGSSTTIAQLCQQEQAILITADSSYLSLIFSEAKPPWGVLLLPNNPSEQKEAIQGMLSGELRVRSSEEGMAFTEYVRRNRMILDVRGEWPELIVISKCQWK